MMKKNRIFFILLALIGCKTAEVKESTLFTVGSTPVSTKEFLYVYNKNNFQEKKEDSVKAKKEYLDLFMNFKLKIKEAERLGMDTTESFKTEFEGYRKQLAQPYLSDRKKIDSMVIEGYERLKSEVNASHILIPVSPSANPADTVKALSQVQEIRKKIQAGEDFAQLARKFSGDSSAKFNNGNLGYFTSMQMVYPFESAAYKTPVGQVSEPVRTQFGYHIIKVNDKRPSQGSAQVAHIMLRTNPGSSSQEQDLIKEKAVKIYEQLKKGAQWNDMVKQFSEDKNSKEKEGKMEWFSVGNITPSFENAAFALKNPGDITEPVQTPYGWHIIKLIERKPLDSFENMQANIKSRINKESRSSASKDIFINRLKKEYNYTENPQGLKVAQTLLDSLTAKGTVPKVSDTDGNLTLFKLANQNTQVKEFYSYLQNQKAWTSQGELPVNYLKEFVNEATLKYEESRLADKYEDYRMLMKEYKEGILLFSLMDENVWSKAVKDTVALKNYFDKNKATYLSKDMADVISISFTDSIDLNKTIDSLKAKGDVEKWNFEEIQAKLNSRDPLRSQFSRDSLEKEGELYMDAVPWKVGEFKAKLNGRPTYIKIVNIFKPSDINFEDIRGQVISDYQKYLEDEWIKDLKKKYPIQVDQKELKKLGLAQ